MKKVLLAVACSLVLAKTVNAQSVSLNINAGLLENALGTATEPNGGLLELIASPSGTFSAPTSSAYITGDNILLASFAMNTNSGTQGLLAMSLNGLSLPSTVTTGQSLLLRFYPNLTFAGMPATPTLATTYGQVRSSTAEFGPTVDPSETGWFVPAPGSIVDLNYLTTSAGGTYANTTAYATGIVITGLVPEPSTYAMFACGFAGLMGMAVWNRRGKRSPTVA